MYSPEYFTENDTDVLHRLIRQHSFATIVTQGNDGMIASHIPLLLEPSRGEHGTLIGHMARANPQWEDFRQEGEVLAIFQGFHGYISPRWYEQSPVVPTWNYVAVHAYGTATLIEEPESLLALLEKTVQHYERDYQDPWLFQLAEERRQRVLGAIVGFEITIHRLEGKQKLSQDRTVNERQRISSALQASPSPQAQALGDLISDSLTTDDDKS